MTKIISTLTIIITGLLLSSCEEVVEIELETSQERLVINALLNWEKDTSGNEQVIKLSTTSSFYETTLVPATGASVVVTNENGIIFPFIENEPGIYETDSFLPEFDTTYIIRIIYNDEIFEAEDRFTPAVEIDEINQTVDEGFSSDYPEVNVFFTDVEDEENFYRFYFIQQRETELIEDFDFTYDDQFEDGNQLTFYYESDDYLPGDVFEITLVGITERFTTYVNLLYSQADGGIGPFASPPVNVKGNFVNITNEDNYPYGYFGLSEFVTETYIFQ